jgi:hypothetical protein
VVARVDLGKTLTCPTFLSHSQLEILGVDPTGLTKPEVIGDFGLRGSVRPVMTGEIAVTVAHITL